MTIKLGRMAELVDALDSKSNSSNAVRVRVSLCPPKNYGFKKNKSTKLLISFKFIYFGGQRETRTLTALLPQDFESCASTSSAIRPFSP